MVGALRWPIRPLIPTDVGLPSVNARAGSWQVLHATVPSADRRTSKNSFRPRAGAAPAADLAVFATPAPPRSSAAVATRTTTSQARVELEPGITAGISE